MQNKKLKKLILSAIVGSTVLASTISASVLLTKNTQTPQTTNSSLRSNSPKVSNNTIATDFNNFSNKSKFQLWNTDQINLSYKELFIPKSNDILSFRSQVQYLQHEYWSYYVSNNLNEISSKNLLNFTNNTINESVIDNLVSEAIDSVWSTEDKSMPRPNKQSLSGGKFLLPENSYKNENVNVNDLSKTKDLFGTSLSQNQNRKWNYYSIMSPTDKINVTVWNSYYNPVKDGNKPILKKTITNKIQKSNLSLKNNSFKYSSLAYKIPEINELIAKGGNTPQGGWQEAKFKLFDNSILHFQNGSARNRSFNNWYQNNYWDYSWKKSGEVDNQNLGNQNTTNKLENIYVDLSKLITIDSSKTTNYATDTNDFWKTTTPQITFGWNTELFSAFKEVSLLASYARNIYNDWSKIIASNLPKDIAPNITRLMEDIYNQKVGTTEALAYFSRLRRDYRDYNYQSSTKFADYKTVLVKNNWALDYSSFNEGLGIANIANTMTKRAFVYDYILPQIFKNDIYADYQIEGNNTWITDKSSTKLYDGATKTWIPIKMIDYQVASKKLDNNVSMYLKNFYMQDPNTQTIIAGKNNVTNNNTLNATNIANIAKTSKNHKITTSGDSMKITWKWNPHLTKVDAITTGSKSRALETPWYFVSQALDWKSYPIEKRTWNELTTKILKLPKATAIDEGTSFSYVNNLSTSQWSSYPELLKSSELNTKFRNMNTTQNKNTKAYYDARRALNDLGYIYLTVDSEIPLNYYLSDAEYKRLQQDNTFIPNGKTGNYYKYFVKYSFKAKPLKLDNLINYLDVKFTSSNESNPTDRFANKNLTVSFNTPKMSQDLAGMKEVNQFTWTLSQNSLHEFFDVTYEEFWTKVLEIIKTKTQNTDWKLNLDSFKYKPNGNTETELNNWIYTNKWTYSKSNSTQLLTSLVFNASIVTQYKEMDIQDLSSKVNVKQGDVTVSQLGELQNQKALTTAIAQATQDLKNNDFAKLMTQLKAIDLKIAKQKLVIQKIVKEAIADNQTLSTKLDEILNTHNANIEAIVTGIKADYEAYKNNNKYESNGFVSSTLNKQFDYKDKLEAIKKEYEQQNTKLSNLINDNAIKQEIKDKVHVANQELINEIEAIEVEFKELLYKVQQLHTTNNGLIEFASNLGQLNANETIYIDFLNDNKAYLADQTINGYWIANANAQYKHAINKQLFIDNVNEIVNGSLSPIIGMNIKFDESMFRLVQGGTQLTGFVQQDNGKTATIKVNYATGSNKEITKLQFEITVNSNVDVRNNQLSQAHQLLAEIKDKSEDNGTAINNFVENVNPALDEIQKTLQDIAALGEAKLPNIFGTAEQLANIEKEIANYKPLSFTWTKLNDGFLATVICGSIAGVVAIVGLTIFLLSLRKRKTLVFSESEKEEIAEAVKEFNNSFN